MLKHFQPILDVLPELNFFLIASFHVFLMTLYLIMPCGSHSSWTHFFSERAEYLIKETPRFHLSGLWKRSANTLERKKEADLPFRADLFATKKLNTVELFTRAEIFYAKTDVFSGGGFDDVGIIYDRDKRISRAGSQPWEVNITCAGSIMRQRA